MTHTYNTLVVVDDNAAILTALKICLAAEFERIVTLTSPDTLVATLAKEEAVDAVLLDMNFSLGVNTGQDGLFWLRTIKKLHPNTPVILITAYADVQLAVKGLKYGAADFVTKPWDNDRLIAALHEAIDKSREVIPLEQMEQEHVQRAVDQCHGNMSRTAEMLGITRQTLYKKLKKKKPEINDPILYHSSSRSRHRHHDSLAMAPPTAALAACPADA